MSITSEEVNYLILRYLRESGFKHTSFAFQYESQLDSNEFHDLGVKPGELLNILQKGLQYLTLETHLNDDGTIRPCGAAVRLIGHHHCEKVTPSNQSTKRKGQRGAPTEIQLATASPDVLNMVNRTRHDTDKPEGNGTAGTVQEKSLVPPDPEAGMEVGILTTEPMAVEESIKTFQRSTSPTGAEKALEQMQLDDRPEALVTSEAPVRDVATPLGDPLSGLPPSPPPPEPTTTNHNILVQVVTLQGHDDKVCACSWNPHHPGQLATGSYDATARIWTLDQTESTPPSETSLMSVRLVHTPADANQPNRHVTTVEWDAEGTWLATGAFDGQGRVWTATGQLQSSQVLHQGPILALKWCPSGGNSNSYHLVSTSVDTTAVLWDVKTGHIQRRFTHHQAPVLDVAWLTSDTFSTCSADGAIAYCSTDHTTPLHILPGAHQQGVNALRVDPTGRYLASASDDETAKIWAVKDGQSLATLVGHRGEVYSLEWSPIAKVTNDVPSILATCSTDHSVRVWDALSATCLFVLEHHTEPVFSLTFSPNGKYLATGSLDCTVCVWSTKSGKLLKSCTCPASVLELGWSPTGDYVVCCLANNTPLVMDGRMAKGLPV
ncbi:hypothetical protein IWQ61_006738 [Dispira simplex]|nr:hypothetical protein IWQ61_006738 [Dispira simplex]